MTTGIESLLRQLNECGSSYYEHFTDDERARAAGGGGEISRTAADGRTDGRSRKVKIEATALHLPRLGPSVGPSGR